MRINIVKLFKCQVHSRLTIAPKPETVDVHPDGTLLAISTQTPGKEIILIPVQNGTFGQSSQNFRATLT